MNTALWIIQGILGFLFIMAGFMKASSTQEVLIDKVGNWVEDFSGARLKIIGILEILGAIGLILPALLKVIPVLTPIAAAALALTMLFAARVHIRRKEWKSVIGNFVLLLLATFIFIGRIFLDPIY